MCKLGLSEQDSSYTVVCIMFAGSKPEIKTYVYMLAFTFAFRKWNVGSTFSTFPSGLPMYALLVIILL